MSEFLDNQCFFLEDISQHCIGIRVAACGEFDGEECVVLAGQLHSAWKGKYLPKVPSPSVYRIWYSLYDDIEMYAEVLL